MGTRTVKANRIVAALAAAVWFSLLTATSTWAQAAELDRLFADLGDPARDDWHLVEDEIWRQWSRSGSASMDLLLERGREAMEAGAYMVAVEHLTALVDHAPDFAEGWNARATAYFHIGLYGPSIEDIRRTLVLEPRHFGALAGLALILEDLDRPEQALEAWLAAQAIHPHMPGIDEAIERLGRQVSGTDL